MLSACGVSFYALAFVQAADILSTCGVIWLWDNFSEAITGSLVCRSSLNHSNVHLIVCVDRSVRHFEFPSEHFMYSFPKGLFRDIFLPIFIEIGSYFTEPEQKISWYLFLRHGVTLDRSLSSRKHLQKTAAKVSTQNNLLGLMAGDHTTLPSVHPVWRGNPAAYMTASVSSRWREAAP